MSLCLQPAQVQRCESLFSDHGPLLPAYHRLAGDSQKSNYCLGLESFFFFSLGYRTGNKIGKLWMAVRGKRKKKHFFINICHRSRDGHRHASQDAPCVPWVSGTCGEPCLWCAGGAGSSRLRERR